MILGRHRELSHRNNQEMRLLQKRSEASGPAPAVAAAFRFLVDPRGRLHKQRA